MLLKIKDEQLVLTWDFGIREAGRHALRGTLGPTPYPCSKPPDVLDVTMAHAGTGSAAASASQCLSLKFVGVSGCDLMQNMGIATMSTHPLCAVS